MYLARVHLACFELNKQTCNGRLHSGDSHGMLLQINSSFTKEG